MDVRVFGIRHHGPGSTLRLIESLDQFQPETVLIEGPWQASDKINGNQLELLKPPIALSSIHPKTHEAQGFYPFAEFSPEWQAVQWSHKNNRSAHFIDLPSHHPEFNEQQFVADPLKKLSMSSGFTDTENWWDHHFEQVGDGMDIWQQIITLIRAVRPSEASVREIFMSQQIKKHSKGLDRVAIVCGAWHCPILVDWAKHCNKKISPWKLKSDYYWVPWTYRQLSESAGYGAGVKAPLYYEHLWAHPKDPATFWFVHAANVFRKQSIDVSPAHLIESSRLSQNLASLRGRRSPGLGELWDAIESVFPFAEQQKWKILKQDIWIGSKVGFVDPAVNDLPLIKDFYQKIKSFRLTKLIETEGVDVKKLDLRKPFHLEMSRFFNQLLSLGLKWPSKVVSETEHRGTFNEYWDLEVDFVLNAILIEHAHKGHTIRDAAIFEIKAQLAKAPYSVTITQYLDLAIRSDLNQTIPELIIIAHDTITHEGDGLFILKALMNLHRSLTFGKIISFPSQELWSLWEYLHQKLYIHLEEGLSNISEEDIHETVMDLKSFHLTESWIYGSWFPLISRVSQDDRFLPQIRGLAARFLLDMENNSEAIVDQLQYEFSDLGDITTTTQWLSGFLSTGRIDLLEHEHILPHIHMWINALSPANFDEALISLRKSFAIFSEGEKRHILDLIFSPKKKMKKSETSHEIFKELYESILGEKASS